MDISKICIGAMRFKDRESAIKVIHKAIDSGFNYIDTSPCYCRKSEEVNSEAWVGEALKVEDYRKRVILSTKCSPGNGGMELGEFKPEGGFGVRTREQLAEVFAQSLKRLDLEAVDYYHLWTTHTMEQFNAAMEPGGWYDGVMDHKDKWQHLGVTTHAESETVIKFLESGKFETVTIPLNVINLTRLPLVDYCRSRGIEVIAMNPFAGGFLAQDEEIKELALRYLMLIDVHPLIGFSSVEEVEYAKWIEDTMPEYKLSADEITNRISDRFDTDEPRCTACGYCQPCPQSINVGASLSYYNMYKYMGMEEARKAFQEKQWEFGLQLKRCTACGLCESRCPNKLPVRDIIKDACDILYDQDENKA